jgi:hypothetical protein
MNFYHNQECLLSLSGLYISTTLQPCLMFASKAGADLSGAPELLALPTNIRLGWKDLPGTNTLIFYKNL